MEPINITISHRGASHALAVLPDSTIESLQLQLEALTLVPPVLQKLLYKGKKPKLAEDATVMDAGLKDGSKIQLLGSTEQELGGLHAVEAEHARRERILKERALKTPVKLRSTTKPSDASSNYVFQTIKPLPHLPNPPSALAILEKLANDPAVVHVMQKHKFSVGLLTELAPHEDPGLLGLNKNAGESILLRIRSDAYDGFRPYLDIRRVCMHELSHNVWGDHDNNFKELNSLLNREVVEFERAQRDGTHHLGPIGDGIEVYMPPDHLEAAEARGQTLGGGGPSSSSRNESVEERRRRTLDATMNRRKREEEGF